MEGLRDRVPFRVCRVLHDAVVNPVALPLTKVLVVTAGWTNLTHRGRSVSLAEGDGAVPPTGALVGGEPLTEVETVTLYVDPEFLQQQIAWARLSTPIASTFNAAAQGAGQILALRSSPVEWCNARVIDRAGVGQADRARSGSSVSISSPVSGTRLRRQRFRSSSPR